jgi:hypothetical protein
MRQVVIFLGTVFLTGSRRGREEKYKLCRPGEWGDKKMNKQRSLRFLKILKIKSH